MNPMSPIDDDVKIAARCLSPQDKLKGGSLLLAAAQQRSSNNKKQQDFVKKEPTTAAFDVDMDSGWISDDNLRAMDFDDRLNQDIDWVVHDDDLDMSLAMDFDADSDGRDDVVSDFGFGPTSYLSPLRGGLLTFEDSSAVSSSFECVNMELPERNATDAEKLLMSFDTMNFTIPSPTSSSSKHKRASLFARKDPGKGGAPARSSSGGAASTGSMSPSLKLKVSARALTPEELLEEQAAAGKASLSGSSSTDPFLGVLSITAPTSEQLLGGENAKKIGSYSPAARKLRIQKFHEKRKNRTWKKSIKYDCRKKLADDRPRIKGRFVRVLENMCDMKDDEPMSPMGDMSPASISSFTPPVTPMSSPEPASAPFSPAMMSPMAPAVATAMPLVATPAPAPTQVPTAALALPPSASVSALSASTAAIASLVASTS